MEVEATEKEQTHMDPRNKLEDEEMTVKLIEEEEDGQNGVGIGRLVSRGRRRLSKMGRLK